MPDLPEQRNKEVPRSNYQQILSILPQKYLLNHSLHLHCHHPSPGPSSSHLGHCISLDSGLSVPRLSCLQTTVSLIFYKCRLDFVTPLLTNTLAPTALPVRARSLLQPTRPPHGFHVAWLLPTCVPSSHPTLPSLYTLVTRAFCFSLSASSSFPRSHMLFPEMQLFVWQGSFHLWYFRPTSDCLRGQS